MYQALSVYGYAVSEKLTILRVVVAVLDPERAAEHEVVRDIPVATHLDLPDVFRLVRIDGRVVAQLLAFRDANEGPELAVNRYRRKLLRAGDQSSCTPANTMLLTVVGCVNVEN